MKFNVLVVDDEKNIRTGLAKALEMDGYNAFLAEDGAVALSLMEENEIDLVITDLKMPSLSGAELLTRVSASYPTVPVIILTGHGTIADAVDAMKAGAYDFVEKPLNLERLSLLVKRALTNRDLVLRYRALHEELEKKNQFANIIGKSDRMKRIFEVVKQVAPTKASVLISGESGVGKEVIADAIHYNSRRKEKPLIKVHCAALSETLLESELFGHERGAFTGAVARKRGRFELAHSGTLFLDEIGEINQNIQIKILRVLQDKKFERVGGEETLEVDVRILAATNRDLQEAIQKGEFREDLYYRLNVVSLEIPPLRDRKEDIPLLISAFIKEIAHENGKQIDGIDSKAASVLYSYSWPGNVRELRNGIESAIVMAKSRVITLEDLPPSIRDRSDDSALTIRAGMSLADVEREVIEFTLHQNRGNKSKTADVLGIGRKTLHRKLQEYQVSD
jgi:DNA-binding NtrC family response regulator